MWSTVLVLPLLLAGAAAASVDLHHYAAQQLLESVSTPDALRPHVEALLAQNETVDGVGDCLVGLGQWAGGLATLELWALKMIDSSSKLVTGVLYGSLRDLGNFDECLAAGDVARLGWSGRYTLPRITVAMRPRNATAGNTTSTTSTTSTTTPGSVLPLPTGLLAKGVPLYMAVCVPGTCQPAVLRAALQVAANAVNEQLGWTALRCTLGDTATSVAGPPRETETSDYVVMCVCAALGLLVLVATVLDMSLDAAARTARRKAFALLVFSAKENGKRLLKPAGSGDFTCINGIRFFSAMWVILGHRYLGMSKVPFMNLMYAYQRAYDLSTMVIINGPLSVDSFFLVGGLVNCYGFLTTTRKTNRFNVIMYNVHRYVRLTPSLALMMAITGTWLSLLGTGPMWMSTVESERGHCQQHWWSNLLYVANYVNPQTPCMGQTWYLMVDMQLHWLSPLLLYPLWKWGRWGVAWLLFALAVTCAIPFALTFVYELPAPFPSDLDVDKMRTFMTNMYYATHPRATAYVFGTLCGYLLFLIKTEQIKIRMTPNRVAFGWLCSTVLCLVVLFSGHTLMDHRTTPYNVWAASFYAGLYRLGWSLGLAWVVLACILGYGGPVNAFLSCSLLTVLGRLTYGIFLAHEAVQMMDRGIMRSSLYYSDFKMVESLFSDAVFSTFFALALCFAVEAPIMALEKHFRTPPKKVEKEVLEEDVHDEERDQGGATTRSAGEDAVQRASSNN